MAEDDKDLDESQDYSEEEIEAFGEDPKKAADEKPAGGKPAEDKGGDDEGKETPATDGEDKGKDKKEDEDKGQEKTAAQIAAELADELDGGKKPDDQDDGKPPKDQDDGKKPDDDKTGDAPQKLTKEKIGEYLGLLTDDDLPKGPILIGDEEIDLESYRKDYPEEFNSIKVLVPLIAEKIIEKKLGAGLNGFVKAEDHAAEVGELRGTIDTLLFWDEVKDAHPDGRTIARSEKFATWAKAQPPKIQLLYGSNDPRHAIALLDAYKEEIAKKNVKEKDKEDGERKKQKDGLHGGGLRSAGGSAPKPSSATEKEGEEAGEAAFEEATGAAK